MSQNETKTYWFLFLISKWFLVCGDLKFMSSIQHQTCHKLRIPHKEVEFQIPCILHHVRVKSVYFCVVWIMLFLDLFPLSLPFQKVSSYGMNRGSMISASWIASICFQIWIVTKPSSPLLGVAFIFMPHRIRMPKVSSE